MIIILRPDVSLESPEAKQVLEFIARQPGVSAQVHNVKGAERELTELYLIGKTSEVSKEAVEALTAVERAVRISEKYRLIGRHKGQIDGLGFVYNGVKFD